MLNKVLLLVVAVSAPCLGTLPAGLRVKFAYTGVNGVTRYFRVPQTIEDAVICAWKQQESPVCDMPGLTMYSSQDNVLSGYYDDLGHIVGLQVAIPKDEIYNDIYDWTALGYTFWTVTDCGESRDFWTQHVYFISKETLEKSKEERLALRNNSQIIQGDFIWVKGFNGTLDAIPVDAAVLSAPESPFKKQSCMPGMGQHYYYEMTPELECRVDTLYPWFTMVHDGRLITTGVYFIGQINQILTDRNWFEITTDGSGIKAVIPNGPQCLYDLADNYGTVSMHIYTVEEPWLITCP